MNLYNIHLLYDSLIANLSFISALLNLEFTCIHKYCFKLSAFVTLTYLVSILHTNTVFTYFNFNTTSCHIYDNMVTLIQYLYKCYSHINTNINLLFKLIKLNVNTSLRLIYIMYSKSAYITTYDANAK